MKNLTKLQVNNGAMVAMDYQTGEIVAYVGSAGYYRADMTSPQFQPQFDVLGNGWRQPGSAFKPFNYVTGINDRHDDRGVDVHGRHDEVPGRLRATGLHPQGRRPARARAAAPAPGAPVLAQHPGGQGARRSTASTTSSTRPSSSASSSRTTRRRPACR